MVTEMTKYDFILLSGDADAFLEKLQSVGVVDITRSMKPIDEKSEKLSARAEIYRKAISALKEIEKADDPGQKPTDFAVEVMETVRDKDAIEAQLPQLRKDADELVPWGQFDAKSFDRLKEMGLKLHFYKAKAIDPEWKEQYAISEISNLGGYSYFVVVSDSDDYDFPLKELPAPDRDYAAIQKQIADLEAQVKQKEHRLAQLKWHEPVLQAEMDKTLSKLDLHLAHVSGEKAAEDYITVFEGFAPAENEPALHDMLEKENILYLVDKAKVDDNPPIKLKNNKFVSKFELLTDMYGRPKYDEFDPTVFISIFFMLFFAFCMGDAGYGLVLILAGILLKKKMPSIASLGIVLGIATTVIGLLFHTFFSMDMLEWSWIPEGVKKCMVPKQIFGFDGTMVLAILVGIVHICLAMIVKTYQSTKVKGFANSLATWGWTLLIVGGVIVGGLALMGVIDKALTKWIVIVIGCLSALGIFFLNDLHRNPLLNVGSGLWETYNTATGLLGDVLSYLRLYALGLAGAKLGEAFNAIGLQALGDGGARWIAFILIVLVGHTLNVAMCVLGAFVHPLRLNFLEFFKNSGYEGSGRRYKPLTQNNEN
ncbi:MAG: V-type H+-transporting ATPase subunit I [bacterium F082]|nr:MAG: V-type H+-transporting ATPase subunit I [bacterium F082]KWW29230.1 MAG: V-type H+-transporting ATPase subunit I [bacterium P201]